MRSSPHAAHIRTGLAVSALVVALLPSAARAADASEVTPNRGEYGGSSTVNAELGGRAAHLFDRQGSLFQDVDIARPSNGIKNSPLKDRSTESRLAAGYMCRF